MSNRRAAERGRIGRVHPVRRTTFDLTSIRCAHGDPSASPHKRGERLAARRALCTRPPNSLLAGFPHRNRGLRGASERSNLWFTPFTLGSSLVKWNLLELPQLRHACWAGFVSGQTLTAWPILRLEVF